MLLNHQIRWLETSCETAGVSEGRKRCFFSAKQQVQLWPITVLNGLIYHDIKRHHTYGPTNSYFYGLISWYISPASGVSSVHLYHNCWLCKGHKWWWKFWKMAHSLLNSMFVAFRSPLWVMEKLIKSHQIHMWMFGPCMSLSSFDDCVWQMSFYLVLFHFDLPWFHNWY